MKYLNGATKSTATRDACSNAFRINETANASA
jgi:hypothetical protein